MAFSHKVLDQLQKRSSRHLLAENLPIDLTSFLPFQRGSFPMSFHCAHLDAAIEQARIRHINCLNLIFLLLTGNIQRHTNLFCAEGHRLYLSEFIKMKHKANKLAYYYFVVTTKFIIALYYNYKYIFKKKTLIVFPK